MPTPANSQLFCDNERAFIDVLPDGPHEQRESARDDETGRDRPGAITEDGTSFAPT
jgi:hypothetical protein